MNARYALIPILGASALLLSGCFSTLQPAVAPQSSTTDPIAKAQYIQYNTSTRANALINFGGLDKDYAVEETASHRMFDHVWLANPVIFQDHLTLDAAQLEARFSEICTNLQGAVSDEGWCVDAVTRNYPLFWAKTNQFTRDVQGIANKYSGIYVLAPASGKDHKDPLWLQFAKGQGFLGRDERRAQAKEMLKDGKGVMVCRTVTHGMKPLWRGQDKGYIEETANKRVKIRIFESVKDRTAYGGAKARKDVNNETIWDRPDNWYICE